MKPFLIKRILIPLDFSFTSLKALDHATVLARKTNAEIYLFHVVENFYATTDPLYFSIPRDISFENQWIKLSQESLEKIADKLTTKGLNKVKCITVSGRTHKEIIRQSKKIKADLIVQGTHGASGVSEFLMGSNTFRVVYDAECPVLSVRRKNKSIGYKNILVPFNDQPHSREKVMYAIKIAELFKSTIHILGFDGEISNAQSKKITLETNQVKSIVEKHELNYTSKIIRKPYTADAIMNYSKRVNADLITVIGDADKQDITEYIKGSLAQQIINHSEVPVLSIHSMFNTNTVDLRFY